MSGSRVGNPMSSRQSADVSLCTMLSETDFPPERRRDKVCATLQGIMMLSIALVCRLHGRAKDCSANERCQPISISPLSLIWDEEQPSNRPLDSTQWFSPSREKLALSIVCLLGVTGIERINGCDISE
jgi:hypothetical protein